MSTGRVAMCLACVLLSACTSYRAEPIAAADRMQAFEARTLDSPELLAYVASHRKEPGEPTAAGAWDFKALTLAAFYYSPELDVARIKHGGSVAAVQSAAQRPNPSLQLPFEYNTNAKNGDSPYTFGLGLDIPFETAGKRGYRIARARSLSDAARLNIGQVAWQVRSALRQAMLDLYAGTGRAALLERQLAASEQTAAMLDRRLASGAIAAPEAALAHITLAQGRQALAQAQQQVLDARARIAGAVGVPLGALAQRDLRFDAFEGASPELPPAEARRHAILNRADLLGALAEYAAAQEVLQLEIARQVPDLHLGPGYTFDAGARKIALPVSGIALPVFNRNQGQIAEAEAQRKLAAARFAALQAQAINQAESAAQAYAAALDAMRLAASVQAAQERQQQAVQKRFDAGQVDRLALVEAHHAALVDMLAYHEARVGLQQRIGQLEDAMQRPLSDTDLPVVPE